MLPKRDGMSVVKELRARKDMVPVLILSAKDSLEDIVAGLNSGSDDYLAKPFAFAELRQESRPFYAGPAWKGARKSVTQTSVLTLLPTRCGEKIRKLT
jgi:DNA-binding response OmpR family regulator